MEIKDQINLLRSMGIRTFVFNIPSGIFHEDFNEKSSAEHLLIKFWDLHEAVYYPISINSPKIESIFIIISSEFINVEKSFYIHSQFLPKDVGQMKAFVQHILFKFTGGRIGESEQSRYDSITTFTEKPIVLPV